MSGRSPLARNQRNNPAGFRPIVNSGEGEKSTTPKAVLQLERPESHHSSARLDLLDADSLKARICSGKERDRVVRASLLIMSDSYAHGTRTTVFALS